MRSVFFKVLPIFNFILCKCVLEFHLLWCNAGGNRQHIGKNAKQLTFSLISTEFDFAWPPFQYNKQHRSTFVNTIDLIAPSVTLILYHNFMVLSCFCCQGV